LGAAFPAEDILADRLKSRHAAQLRDWHRRPQPVLSECPAGHARDGPAGL
jgi:hypothetical protein